MGRLSRTWVGVVGVFVAVAGPVTGVVAQQGGLSETEKQLAYQVEETAVQQLRMAPNNPWVGKGIPQLARTPAGLVKKSVVTDVTLLGSPGTSSPGVRQALVTRYEYATGVTILTVVDLKGGAMVEVRAEANRPTPLAADEVQRAIALAGRAVPDLAVTPRSAVQILSVVQSKPTSRRYGHRLAVVWRDGPPASRRVLVDLTTEQVVDANF